MTLEPETLEYVRSVEKLGLPPYPELGVEGARRAMEEAAERLGPPVEVAAVEDTTVPGPEGPLRVRIYRPSEAAELPLLFWYHGGGWVLGSLETHDRLCRALAREIGAAVASVEYRLAPEHRFPRPVEDAYAAAAALHREAGARGFDPDRIAVGGDSAGGNLAAVTALLARDRGGPPLRYQLLVYPITHSDFETPSYRENAEGYLLTRDLMKWFWDLYLERSEDARDPRAAPLRAPDLTNLPPALVITAEHDPLRDEGEAYARRLAEAGVPVTLSRYAGTIHGFFRLWNQLEVGRRALEEAGAALRAALGGR